MVQVALPRTVISRRPIVIVIDPAVINSTIRNVMFASTVLTVSSNALQLLLGRCVRIADLHYFLTINSNSVIFPNDLLTLLTSSESR